MLGICFGSYVVFALLTILLLQGHLIDVQRPDEEIREGI